ncbi:putative carbonic anhydrase 3 [Ctenocephalides felis]|uniref:putative carbonic anhydrase 3 n=1 Tax=Ctenocephalides felis TaxID=7515 RepID=UPI000E6E216C|nr:putative carbonic anhydrase 3 [Ctenocephalides felis]
MSFHFQISDEDNEALDIILDSAKKVLNSQDSSQHPLEKEINLSHFLPQNRYNFYRYEGSLTTPTCDEVVLWTVFEHSLPISDEQLKIFQKTHTTGDSYLKKNYRATKPLGDRMLKYNDFEMTSNAPIFGVSKLLLSTAFVARSFFNISF